MTPGAPKVRFERDGRGRLESSSKGAGREPETLYCDHPGCGRISKGPRRSQALGSHKQREHGVLQRAAQVVYTTVCPVCGAVNDDVAKARLHFKYSSCSQVPWVAEARPEPRTGRSSMGH